MFSFQWEGSNVVIEAGTSPTVGAMTGPAVGPKATTMVIVVGVAGVAIGRCALENAVLMTCFTVHLGMFPLQLEGRQVMVERCLLPAIGCVAGLAGCAKP